MKNSNEIILDTDFEEFRNLCQDYEESPDIEIGAELQELSENIDDRNSFEVEEYNKLVDEFPWVFDQIGYQKIDVVT